MEASQQSGRMVRFGTFELDLAAGELRKNGARVRLQDQPFQLLAALAARPGEVVTREELKDKLWPADTYVDFDRSLNTAASKLRDALGDSATSPRFIETLPRRGYRFLASVEGVGELAAGGDGSSTVAIDSPADGRARAASDVPPRERELVRRLRLTWSLVAIAALAALVVSLVYLSEPRPESLEAPLRRFTITPPGPIAGFTLFTTSVAISPNGRYIAYSSRESGLQIQDLDRYQPRTLDGTEGAKIPFWSPDSDFIGFVAGGELRKISVQGGPTIRLCELPQTGCSGATWSLDGERIVFSSGPPPKLYEVPAGGGAPNLLVLPDEPEGLLGGPKRGIRHPRFLPPEAGPRVLVFAVESRDGYTLMVQDLETGRRGILGPGAHPVYSPSGHIIYQGVGAAYELWALPFSLNTLKATGEAFPVAENSGHPTVAADQTLVYLDASSSRQRLIWLNRSGDKTGVIGQPQRRIQYPMLSPDGRHVAVAGWEAGAPDIWVHEVDRGVKNIVASSNRGDFGPIWSSSGEELIFPSARRGNNDIYRKAADGTGEAQLIHGATDANEFASDLSRDGRYILYDLNGSDIWYLERRDGDSFEAKPFLATDLTEKGATLSPDGGWVAYVSDESGAYEVYVQRFPEGGDKQRISQNGGLGQRWGRDGRKLYYVEGETLVEVEVKLGSKLSVVAAAPLFSTPGLRLSASTYAHYDVSADGERFVVRELVSQGRTAIHVVQNWFAEFKDRQGGDE